MTTSQGFSLIEVLITLFVILTTTFGLISQQWLTLRLFNDAATQWNNLLTTDNETELKLAGVKASRFIVDERSE